MPIAGTIYKECIFFKSLSSIQICPACVANGWSQRVFNGIRPVTKLLMCDIAQGRPGSMCVCKSLILWAHNRWKVPQSFDVFLRNMVCCQEIIINGMCGANVDIVEATVVRVVIVVFCVVWVVVCVWFMWRVVALFDPSDTLISMFFSRIEQSPHRW